MIFHKNTIWKQCPARLVDLVDKICAKLPSGGKLYVAKIIPISYADATSYNNQITSIVQNKKNQRETCKYGG
jgi:hypothetical protein